MLPPQQTCFALVQRQSSSLLLKDFTNASRRSRRSCQNLGDKMPPKAKPPYNEKLPPQVTAQLQKRMGGAIQAAKSARATADDAEKVRAKANETADPELKRKFEHEAAELDKKAQRFLKIANRLENGALQGAGAGAGIGAATGLGLGAVVGTIVGGVAAVPTTLLGGLIGAGTGAIHGPGVKFTGGGGDDEDTEERIPTQKIEVQDLEALEAETRRVPAPAPAPAANPKATVVKKKPRKIEIRNPNAKKEKGNAVQ
jgi:hypothetical protein